MEQLQRARQARRKKSSVQLEFDASKVFGTSKDHELELDLDAARYQAWKGQGGDRRA